MDFELFNDINKEKAKSFNEGHAQGLFDAQQNPEPTQTKEPEQKPNKGIFESTLW